MLLHMTYRCKNHVYFNSFTRQYSSKYSKRSGGGGRAFFAVGALVLTGGATMAYAKYDPNFRKTLIHYIPITESFLTKGESSGNISDFYGNVKSLLFELVTGKSTKSTDKLVTKSGHVLEKPPEPQEYKGK